MAEFLIIVSKIKKMVKEMGMRTSMDMIEKLNQLVESKVKTAVEKAKTANRKTVQAADID